MCQESVLKIRNVGGPGPGKLLSVNANWIKSGKTLSEDPSELVSPVHLLGSPRGEEAVIPPSVSAALEGISGPSSGLELCSSRV